MERGPLGPANSDALLERDDPKILRALAASDEMQFSDVGIVKLVYAAKNDKELADLVVRRNDVPPEMLPFLKMANASSGAQPG